MTGEVVSVSETNASPTLPEPIPVSASVSASPSSSSTVASPSGKRSRDPEDEVYVDNLHSHKRYLSEVPSISLTLKIMASSLNGLSVGDPLRENLMDSPARSDSMFYLRDEMSLQYSPMSEDLDIDCRYYETNTCSSQPDSQPTSPVSPYRFQRPASAFSPGPSTNSSSLHGPTMPAVTSSQARQRGSDSEGRFPSSPSDICHSADLRRAALLRSVQMRAQPLGPPQFDVSYSPIQESTHNVEADLRPCSCIKSLVNEREYHIEEECSSMSVSMHEKSCRVLNMNLKGDDEPTG